MENIPGLVNIGKKIAKGRYSTVFEAVWNYKKVAVKVYNSYGQAISMRMEDIILKQCNHPNLIRLIGVCNEEPMCLILEYMPGGNLSNYLLINGRHQTKKKLCRFCLDVSKGMAYLESKKIIHRYVTAHNCLLGDKDIVKISDFRSSTKVKESVYKESSLTFEYKLLWAAPEVIINQQFSSSTDVWSFGVLLWEVYSCGVVPYPGILGEDVFAWIAKGYRMPPPKNCPNEVSSIMTQCWKLLPGERPNFSIITDKLSQAENEIKN